MRALAELDPDMVSVPSGAAAQTRKRSIPDLAFSFPVMVAATLVVLTVLTVQSRFNDPDLWWHLKTGEIIWNTHSIPRIDLFSFTTNNHPWTAHEWLSQVTIYGAWKAGGYTGLMIWLCVFPSALFIAGYVLCSLYSGNSKVALLGALVTWFFATVGLAVRPHVLGYLLLTCELLIIHLARTKNPRWFLALPPLFAVWVNCHGSFIFGLMILAVFLFCSFIDFHKGSLVSCRWERPQRRMLIIGLALSIAALFVNPVGFKQVIYPLDVMFNQSTGLGSVDEWQPLRFDDVRAFGMLAVAAVIFLSTLVRRAVLYIDELVLLGLGLGMAARHNRMLFVFGMLATPILCRLLSDAWDRYEPARDRWSANAVMMLLACIVVVFYFPNAAELESQVKKNSPTQAVEYIRRMGLSGRMLNDYVYGGYLIWALPEHKVFVDGRADVYEWTGVLDEYGGWVTLRSDPRILLDKYHIAFCLVPNGSPISRLLRYLPGWRMTYSDELSMIFVRA